MDPTECRNILEEWNMALGVVLAQGGFLSDRLCDSRNPQLGCIAVDNCSAYLAAMTTWDDAYLGTTTN